jgi:hypothetical protein
MNPLREVLSLHAAMSSAQRLWLLGAAIAAVCLLSFYVSLLRRPEPSRQPGGPAADIIGSDSAAPCRRRRRRPATLTDQSSSYNP